MFDLIFDFIKDMIESALGTLGTIVSSNGDQLIKTAFHAEEELIKIFGNDIGNIQSVIQRFALYLIVLKLLKKGFDTYILWNDGDADLDPITILIGFFKAIIITLCFTELYGFFVKIGEDFINAILNNITNVDGSVTIITVVTSIMTGFSMAFLPIIIAIIYLVIYLYAYVIILKKGLEIFVLKVSVSLACTGLIDSDGGVFKPFIKKFFQEAFSVMLQVVFLKISLFLMLGNHYLWGFAAISLALSAPQFLSEFIMISGGGGGMNKVTSGLYMASMIKNIKK